MKSRNFIVEQDNKQFVDVTRILPKTLPTGNRIIVKKLDNKLIKISVDVHSGKIKRAKSIIMRKYIQLCEELFQLLGLFFGDGIKLKASIHATFGFVNTELKLHKLFLSSSKKCFSVNSNMFKCSVKIPIEMKSDKEKIKENISKELKIPLENFRKFQIKDDINLVCANIVIDSRLLAFTIQLLFEKLKLILKKNKKFCSNFLQGVLAAEGCIIVRKCGRLDGITIGSKKKINRKFIRKLLLNLDIKPSKDAGKGKEAVTIYGLSNFKKIEELNLTTLHPTKNQKFKKALKKFKREHFRKGEGRFLILKILSEGSETREEIAKTLNRSSRTVSEIDLILLRKLGFVKRNRIGNKIISYSITQNGLKILNRKNPLDILKRKAF